VTTPIIISASRRTDMPRFHLDVLTDGLRRRRFAWHHPFNGRLMELALPVEQKAVLVLWSKDFDRFLENRSAFEGWPLFFHFTINTPLTLLEPDLPPLRQRLCQLEQLASLYSPEAVRWRFDPIVCWESGGQAHDNLRGLEAIAPDVAAAGVKDVTVSFMDHYRKIDRRLADRPLTFRTPSPQEQVELFAPWAAVLTELKFTVHTCCEPVLASGIQGVRPGRCIDADLLSRLTGMVVEAKDDLGQRRDHGCLCHRSIDIGCYAHHRCRGQCLYCYARP
jgi:hypothetical protein